jgi:hypothetical protein
MFKSIRQKYNSSSAVELISGSGGAQTTNLNHHSLHLNLKILNPSTLFLNSHSTSQTELKYTRTLTTQTKIKRNLCVIRRPNHGGLYLESSDYIVALRIGRKKAKRIPTRASPLSGTRKKL